MEFGPSSRTICSTLRLLLTSLRQAIGGKERSGSRLLLYDEYSSFSAWLPVGPRGVALVTFAWQGPNKVECKLFDCSIYDRDSELLVVSSNLCITSAPPCRQGVHLSPRPCRILTDHQEVLQPPWELQVGGSSRVGVSAPSD